MRVGGAARPQTAAPTTVAVDVLNPGSAEQVGGNRPVAARWRWNRDLVLYPMRIPTSYIEGHKRAFLVDPDLADAYVEHTLIGDPLADAATDSKIYSERLFDCLLATHKSNASAEKHEINVNLREGYLRKRLCEELKIETASIEAYERLRLLEVVAEPVRTRPLRHGFCRSIE